MKNLHLENLKVGDEVVSIRYNGKKCKYGPIFIVKEFDERFNRWRYSSRKDPDKYIATFPPHGGCKDFMSKNPNPDYYFSANPKHIKAAEKQHMKARIEREKRNEKEIIKLEEFRIKLEKLLLQYGAEIIPIQTHGDTHGVEIEVNIQIGRNGIIFKN